MCLSVLILECLCSFHNWVSGTILIGLSTMQAWQISSKGGGGELSISSEKLTRLSNVLPHTRQTGYSEAQEGSLRLGTRKRWRKPPKVESQQPVHPRSLRNHKSGGRRPKFVRQSHKNIRAWLPWKQAQILSPLQVHFAIFCQGAQQSGDV